MKTTLSARDWEHLQEVFDVAVNLEPALRDSYLEGACLDTPGLRTRVASLIAATEQETSVGAVVSGAASNSVEAQLPAVGGVLGHYRISSIIGRGGMGIVYRAVRADDEYQKEVAIKVATVGLLAPDLRKRFLAERQILANLDHPNIARPLDGGTTPEGIPFVVMELVDGQPIDIHCESAHLGKREKIALMIMVARSVDFAHRHLVVHRDLKPENVHVTADGTPKLLDFGIAKALNPGESGKEANATVDATRLMTPEYASPEQVLGQAITTATDVYQLGILLYLLLTGGRPFSGFGKTFSQLEKSICEVPPARPGIDPDIDRIMLQALEKVPARRYSSAEAFAEDLERYLGGFPVQARATSFSHRGIKFAGRHKMGVTAAALVLLLVLCFSIGMALLARRLQQQRNQTQVQLDRSERVSHLLETVFGGADPESARGTNPTARQLLDRGSAEVSGTLTREPAVQARLFSTLGRVYDSLGVFNRAEDLLTNSLLIRQRESGERSLETAAGLTDLAEVLDQEGHNAKAEKMARQALAIREALTGPASLETAQTLDALGLIVLNKGDRQEAETMFRRSIAICDQLPGVPTETLTHLLSNQSHLLLDKGDFVQAEAVARRMLAISRSGLGEDHPETAQAMTILGELLNAVGKYDEAEAIFRQSVALRRKVLGPRHNSLGTTEGDLASLLEDKGEFDEAEQFYSDALSIHLEALGPDNRTIAIDENNLASLYEDRGQYDKAEPLFRKSLALREKLLAADSPLVARAKSNLGKVLVERGKLVEAKELLDSSLAIRQRKYGEQHPETAASWLAIGKLQEASRQTVEAEATYRRALSIFRASLAPGHPSIAKALELLSGLLIHEGRKREAEPMITEALAIRRKTLPPGSQKIRATQELLALAQNKA